MNHPHLHSLIFEITTNCNLNCMYCYNVWKNNPLYPQGILNTPSLMQIINKALDETKTSMVTLTGGEPLLRADLHEIVDFIYKKRININLITNGTLLNGKNLNGLLGKINLFELPLLANQAKVHDKLCNKQGSFDSVIDAVTQLKIKRQSVILVFVATSINLPVWPQTLELAFTLGADGVMFNRFNPGGNGYHHFDELKPDSKSLLDALDFAELFSAKYNYPISCSIPMPPCLFNHKQYPHINFGFCSAGTDRAYYIIDPIGNLRPCNHSPRILGNLQNSNFWDLVNSQKMNDFIQAKPEFCLGCKYDNLCMGGCKAAAESCLGTCQELDPWINSQKHEIKRIM